MTWLLQSLWWSQSSFASRFTWTTLMPGSALQRLWRLPYLETPLASVLAEQYSLCH